MSNVEFPATERDHFPSQLHEFLTTADAGTYVFPQPEEMFAPPLDNLSARQERMVKFAFFNYWLSALRVYYIHAAWTSAQLIYTEPGDVYAATCRVINARHTNAERELYEHYGYDYQGPVAR